MGAILASATPKYFLTVLLAALDSDPTYIDRMKQYELIGTFADFAAVQTAVDNFLTNLAAASRCDVVDYVIHAKHEGDPGAVTAVGNPYKEAFLTLNVSGGGDAATLSLPAPVAAMISGKNIIENNALLLAHLNHFEVTTGKFALSDGEQIVATNQIKASRLRSVSSGKSFG